MITTDQYIDILRERKYRILHCGQTRLGSNVRTDYMDILKDEVREMTIEAKTLATVEDMMQIEIGIANTLRHFHALVFYEEERIVKILELSKKTDTGQLLWNPCYSIDSGFKNSIWLDEFMMNLGYETFKEANLLDNN